MFLNSIIFLSYLNSNVAALSSVLLFAIISTENNLFCEVSQFVSSNDMFSTANTLWQDSMIINNTLNIETSFFISKIFQFT